MIAFGLKNVHVPLMYAGKLTFPEIDAINAVGTSSI